ncbi:MAG TPA: putative toxin-antitoxin system toxin component, PIN family [Rhodocyclaceae bacterium]|nr:putative toxin-antitoxin system toxin component, PIN family [Rhodocyclaceae bacterium]
MLPATTERPLTRLVLDTNTVMALWFFADPALEPLRTRLAGDTPVLATRADALEELRRVLAYRQFAIPAARQAQILDAYARRCTLVETPGMVPPALPNCRDPHDQKFLEIARDGGASHLVSRDKALLKLNRHRLIRPLFAIVTPERLCEALLLRP